MRASNPEDNGSTTAGLTPGISIGLFSIDDSPFASHYVNIKIVSNDSLKTAKRMANMLAFISKDKDEYEDMMTNLALMFKEKGLTYERSEPGVIWFADKAKDEPSNNIEPKELDPPL